MILMIYKFFLLGVIIGIFSNCNVSNSKGIEFNDVHQLKIIKPKLTDETLNLWKCETKFNTQEFLDQVRFWDDKNGFLVSTDGTIYNTNDGGAIWSKLKSDFNYPDRISNIYFASPKIGWMASVNYSEDVLDVKNNKSSIFKTENGGINWTPVKSLDSVILRDIKFINDTEGWAVGRKRVSSNLIIDRIFILHTNNGGNIWNEVLSNNPNSSGDFAESVIPTTANQAVILTINNKIYSVNAFEDKMSLLHHLEDKPQTYLGKFVFLSDKDIWVIGGADSIEGTWGVMYKKKNSEWSKLEFDFYLNSAISLSENEIIISGPGTSRKETNKNTDDVGVTKYSLDNGETWYSICSDLKLPQISSFFLQNKNQIWAVAENKVILIKRM